MTEKAVIEFKDVSFAYQSQYAIDNANFNIREREYVSIVGPNGGGKTTLILLMLGLLTPQKGQIRVLNESPQSASVRVGYMPQSLHFDYRFPITVQDVVLMGVLRRGQLGPYSKTERMFAQQKLDELGIADLAGKSFSDLSGGQRQRVLLARTLACNPEILLLDEPTANVDARVEKILLEKLSELSKSMTVVLVSHDLSFVSKAVDHVLCVNRTVVRHPTANITPETIAELYHGEMRIVQHGHHLQNGENKHE